MSTFLKLMSLLQIGNMRNFTKKVLSLVKYDMIRSYESFKIILWNKYAITKSWLNHRGYFDANWDG